MITALVNNEWERIPPESLKLGENTFAFKQGLYETFRTLDYRPVFLAPHLDRIFRSAKLTGLPIHYRKKELLNMVNRVVTSFHDPNQRARILVVPNKLIIYTSSLNLDPIIYKGVSAITVLGSRETPDLKTTNYKVCYDAWKLAEKQNCFEAILIDNDGSILEGSRSNIFWVKDGKLFTREGNVLPGITRQTIIKYSPYPVTFESLSQNEICSLDELFLTNSGSGIVPIIQVDKHSINGCLIGKMTHQLLKLYNDWMYNDIKE